MPSKRSDSAHVKTEIIQSAILGVNVPDFVDVPQECKPFWKVITDARAVWTDIDLVHAANLARCMYSIEENQKQLKKEGDVIVNQKGTPIMNPRFSILEQLSRRSVTLSAKIQVHSAATIGEVENNKKKNAAKQKSVKAFEEADDDLLGSPSVQ